MTNPGRTIDGRTHEGRALRAERAAQACELRRRGHRIGAIAERVGVSPATVSMMCFEARLPPAGFVRDFSPLLDHNGDPMPWDVADIFLTMCEMHLDGELDMWVDPKKGYVFRLRKDAGR